MKLKTILFLVLLFSILNNSLNAQLSPTFKLSDTTVYQGQKHVLSGLVTNFRGNYLKESEAKLDSIIEFLKNNPEVILEIGVHTDQRGTSDPNYKLSQQRADALKKDICSKGKINKNRIVAIGYGEEYPIVPIEFISNINDIEEKEKYYSRNRRVELQILEGNIFNKIQNRINVLSKYRYLNDFHFLDSNILKGQDKVISGIITSIDGLILKDSLGQLDSLISFLQNDTSIELSCYKITENYEEIKGMKEYQEIKLFKNFILEKGRIDGNRIDIRPFYYDTLYENRFSLDTCLKYRDFNFCKEYSNSRESSSFSLRIEKSKTSNLKSQKFYDKAKIQILKSLNRYLSDTSYEQDITTYFENLEIQKIKKIDLDLFNRKTESEEGNNIGIGINIFEKEYKDLILLKDWTSDGSDSKIIETKSYVIQMDYLERWSPKYNEIIDQTIYEIEKFFKENYENL